jgi:ATP-dependent RNA helicase DeaD
MKSFTELNLSEPIVRAISELGFSVPSPIQAQALPVLLAQPTDFLGLAATGTGKTAAFSIPLLERIRPSQKGVQALVLCPTRELATQVAGQINLIGKYKGIRALPIYGGAGYGDQIAGLKRGASIVVGTPGRVVDHLERGTLKLDQLEVLVLDEADEMISMGFKEDLESVLGQVPEGQSNIWLFSATMGPEVRKVADLYLVQPHRVQVNRTEMLPTTVEQIYYTTQESNKPEVLCKLVDHAADFYGIVFCQTKALVVDLTQYMKGRGYMADCLHGDMDQNARDRTMKSFRERKINLLIATDVACRGLDVKDITHVINYSIPRELDNYVHRIGRTGRNGNPGLALSLVTQSHRGLIGRIERVTKTKMKEGKIPTRKEIGLKKVAQSHSVFSSQESPARAIELLDESWKKSISGMSKEEIVGRFLTLIHPEIFTIRKSSGN